MSPPRPILEAALLAALTLSARDAPVLPSPKQSWIQVQTANFTLFSSASERRTLEIGRKLEKLRAVLSKIYTKLEVNSPVPTFIYIFRDDPSFMPYKRRDRNMAGYFVGRRDGNYVAVNGDPGIDPLHPVYHEYIHYFLETTFAGFPHGSRKAWRSATGRSGPTRRPLKSAGR